MDETGFSFGLVPYHRVADYLTNYDPNDANLFINGQFAYPRFDLN